jgi:hypothetical protein
VDYIAGLLLVIISVLIIFLPTMAEVFGEMSKGWSIIAVVPIWVVVLISLTGITVGALLMSGTFSIVFYP